jgi:hypothetical protein
MKADPSWCLFLERIRPTSLDDEFTAIEFRAGFCHQHPGSRAAGTLAENSPDISQRLSRETAPSPWILGETVFVVGSAFFIIQEFAPKLGRSTGQTSTQPYRQALMCSTSHWV